MISFLQSLNGAQFLNATCLAAVNGQDIEQDYRLQKQ